MAAAGGVCRGVERHPGGWAAGRLAAQIGPVSALIHTQHIAQLEAAFRHGVAEGVGERGYERAGSVADHGGHREFLPAEERYRMRGDGGGGVRGGRIGQVEAERDMDAAAGRPGTEDHEAVFRGEAEQVRDDGEQGGGGANAKRLRAWARCHDEYLRNGAGWRIGRQEAGQPGWPPRLLVRSWW